MQFYVRVHGDEDEGSDLDFKLGFMKIEVWLDFLFVLWIFYFILYLGK
jgi:hypothetical protein